LTAAAGSLHFSGKLTKDQWQLSLTYPQDSASPQLATLGPLFAKGEQALRNLAAATAGLTDVKDTARIGAMVKPDTTAIQEAVQAAAAIAKTPKKGLSFGFTVGSPPAGSGDTSPPPGVQGTVGITYVF
jgi:hypothetical protein